MKKLLLVMITLLALVGMVFAQGTSETSSAGSAAKAEPSGKLVIYTSAADEEYETIMNGFSAKYPKIEVEAVQAGGGELKTRIKAEAANPQGDIMASCVYADSIGMKDNWEPYIVSRNAQLPKNMQNNTDGAITWNTVQLVCLLVNKAEAAKLGVTIKSYKDLLNPVLKGHIISANPAASSSAWNQLSTMLAAMGGYESEATWNYLDKLAENLGGVLSGSSSKVYKSVLNGEYVVGITYEAPCVTYIEEGKGDTVEIVYPEEGINAIQFGAAMIKGCKHPENAKLYLEWVSSDECQQALAATTQRQVNMTMKTTNPNMKSMTDIKIVDRDEKYLAAHQTEILDRWAKIWAKYN